MLHLKFPIPRKLIKCYDNNMSNTVDEQPKKDIAKKVITPKRKYFSPDVMASVEAESFDDAVSETKKLKPEEKVGDE